MTSALVIRPLGPSGRHALRYTFRQLGGRSRYQRFHGAARELSDRQLERLTAVDHWHHEALVAWGRGARRPLGIARYVRTSDFDVAEVAVEVADEWQRAGVGTTLVRELACAARAAGVRHFAATTLADNAGALRLANAVGRPRLRRAGGALELSVDL